MQKEKKNKKKRKKSSFSITKKKKKSSKKKSNKHKKSKKYSDDNDLIQNEKFDNLKLDSKLLKQKSISQDKILKKTDKLQILESNQDKIKLNNSIIKQDKMIKPATPVKSIPKSIMKSPVKNNSPPLFPNSNYKRDCTKNIGFYDSKSEQMKVKFRVIIPEYINPHLHREKDFISELEEDHKCKISFLTDLESNISTCEGIKGQLVQFAGSLDGVSSAMKNLTKKIMKIEQRLNGRRKS